MTRERGEGCSSVCEGRVNSKSPPDPDVNGAGDPGQTVRLSDTRSCAGDLGTDGFGGGRLGSAMHKEECS